MALTEKSQKFWFPIQQVMDYLTNIVIKPGDKVLDIGPGHWPFARADVSVDMVDAPGAKNLIKCDVANEPLPFADKEFDFVYARHIIEDMYNPFPLIKEMSRVGKAGYIETPSPIAELAKGADGGSPPFRGYHHHRFFVWGFGKELRLVSKYPFAEYLRFDEAEIDTRLLQEKYWNTYFLWEGEIKHKHIHSPPDFNIPTDYSTILKEAMDRSRESTDIFFVNMERREPREANLTHDELPEFWITIRKRGFSLEANAVKQKVGCRRQNGYGLVSWS